MAQAAQATFEVPAEALEFQPQVFPAERGEVLHQQPLATENAFQCRRRRESPGW